MLSYNKNYFINSLPALNNNANLRDPQLFAYQAVREHFIDNMSKDPAVIILPTGVGKTGLMGILPYGIANGRVLIITPQVTIRETVLNSLNPDNLNCFWLKRNIFDSQTKLPVVSEYDGDKTNREAIDCSNIIVANIHKLQSRLESSLIHKFPKDYFDMIIIDEAHHSVARSWVETTMHFSKAKVIKLTGTPIRTDGKPIVGELVYEYKLGSAMAKEYIKSLENITFIPDELYLTLDNDSSKEYTVDEILVKNLKPEDWVRRSVAYSEICSRQVVNESKKILENRKEDSDIPHMIIAVACSIKHAEQIAKLYSEANLRTGIIYSTLEPSVKDSIMKSIERNKLDVIVNVAMLGEGFDHKYLTIGAIFRPYQSQLQYEQFVGRILRRITEGKLASDNVAAVVSHKNIYLDQLWEKYKIEIEKSEIIKSLSDYDVLLEIAENENNGESSTIEYGNVRTSNSGSIIQDSFLHTKLIEKKKIEEAEKRAQIEGVMKLYNVTEEKAREIDAMLSGENQSIKRPDLYFKRVRTDIDVLIRDELVPAVLAKNGLKADGNEVSKSRLFDKKYAWITKRNSTNAACLAIYMNSYLKDSIGKPRKEWDSNDFEEANAEVKELNEFVEKIIMNEIS